MAKLKGKKAFTKAINEFTQKEFGVTAVFGNEFQALTDDKIIEFTLAVDKDMQECVIDDMESRFPDIQTSMFVWLLMHEIGHCMTAEEWDVDDETYFAKAKDRLMDYWTTDAHEDVVARNEWYHLIGDEYFATRWAGRWMRGNPKKMKKFAKKTNKAFKKFFKKNGLTK